MAARSERIQAELGLEAARDRLRRARARLALARAQYRRARATLVRWYRSARARARRRARDYRVAERERVRRQIAQWWAELHELWQRRRVEIAKLGLRAVERAKRLEEHERTRLRELAGHKRRVARQWSEHRAAERRQESDEQVVEDLRAHHPELVPIFRTMAGRIKATPKMSRLEAMLHWAHDNPDEIMAFRAAEQERELREAIAAHEAEERAAHRRRPTVRKAKAGRRTYAEAVPF